MERVPRCSAEIRTPWPAERSRPTRTMTFRPSTERQQLVQLDDASEEQVQPCLPGVQDVTEYQLNEGRSWYNSLQVTGTHKVGNDLTFHGTWTYSKTMDSGGFTDGNYRILMRQLDGNDITHRVTLSGVYMLPVGSQSPLPGRRQSAGGCGGRWLGVCFALRLRDRSSVESKRLRV